MIESKNAVLGDSSVWSTARPIYPMTYGCSLSAILASILVDSLFLIYIVSIEFMKLPSSIPVAASCSAAIAVACHVPLEELDQNVAKNEVMWGDMGENKREIDIVDCRCERLSNRGRGSVYMML